MEAVKPVIDSEYAKSWDGVKLAAEMRRAAADESMDDGEKLYYLIEYYSHLVKNLDEVVESLGGGSVDASAVFAYVNAEVIGAPKN